MAMNLLVTGAAGFIGSEFVRIAEAKGDNVIVLDALTYAGKKENLSGTSCKLIIGNICDGKLVSEILHDNKIDALINFAAESHVDNSIAAPDIFIKTNINGTHTLLEASRQYYSNNKNFRYVQISTDEVFGSLELGDGKKFSETTPYAPSSPYSSSKAAADHLVRAWHHTYGLPAIITNCSNNYGPRQFPEKLIPRMITLALAGEKLPVYGNGANVRDWIHVSDHSNGVYLALTKGQPGQSYCFGGNAEISNIDLVKIICAQLDKLKPRAHGSYSDLITFVTDRAGHDMRYAIDDSKAQRELGFKRKFTFESGLAETIKLIANI